MDFKAMVKENKFTLVVSLPENNLELARAALEGGAQAIKVHANYGTAPAAIPLGHMKKTAGF